METAIFNSKPMAITNNLSHALRYMRRNRILTVWVDAVCINQSDNLEKSLQVQRMKQIYEQGVETISWLGIRGNDLAEFAIRWLQLANKKPECIPIKLRKIRNVWPAGDSQISAEHRPNCLDMFRYDRVLDILGQDPNTRSSDVGTSCYQCALEVCSHALVDLFERPYWRRRWIIQEIAVARQVTVICGTSTMALYDLETALVRSRKSLVWSPRVDAASLFFEDMLELRRRILDPDFTLPEIIYFTSNFVSKDPRDRIYAILGISAEGPQLVPMPSYYRSVQSASVQLTRNLIKKYKRLDMVESDERGVIPGSDLPTWTPEWLSGELPRQVLDSLDINDPRSTLPTSLLMHCLGAENAETLHVQGCLLATITAMTRSTGRQTAGGHAEIASLGARRDSLRYYGSSGAALYVIAHFIMFDQPYSTGSFFTPRLLIQEPLVKRISYYMTRPLRWAVFTVSRWIKKHFFLSYFPTLLGSSSRSETHEPGALEFHQWWEANRDFLIADKSLDSWLCRRAPIHTMFRFLMNHMAKTSIWVWAFAAFTLFSVSLAYSIVPLFPIFVFLPCTFLALTFFPLSYWYRLRSQVKAPLALTAQSKRLVTTDTGMVAQVCSSARLGDKICFIAGRKRAVVMRQVEGEVTGAAHWQIVGSASCFLNADDGERLHLWLHWGALSGLCIEPDPWYFPYTIRSKLLYQSHDPYGDRLNKMGQLMLQECQQKPWWMEFTVV
ncbi:heterokaryon incompatibility protein-domain-containing protein [Stachybotrys elegans]|uniref:Heterokaryon incompatibility protein-domain-containing protein n=1 Tax=Stachybotrys elegans TaxID=80388 RepID=A0A8K0SZJ3_9HYPO|nr:heterokaryon incompatibility protein-domain-containing protein [Stachybotrys elegans]